MEGKCLKYSALKSENRNEDRNPKSYTCEKAMVTGVYELIYSLCVYLYGRNGEFLHSCNLWCKN